MPNLLPATPAMLTLPIAALARLDTNQPAWLRDCLQNVQEEYLKTEFQRVHAAGERREQRAHEAEAVREMLVDAWLDALCPLPMLFAPNRKGARN